MKFRHIRLIIIAAILVLALAYWVGTMVYDHYIASEYSVKLPFHDENGKDMYIQDVNAAKDPTFDQLLTFLKGDSTGDYAAMHPYSLGACIVMLHDNAEKADIRCGVAELKVSGTSDSYAVDVFNTVDRGQVMVDATGDPFDAGSETIIHMDSQELHHMVFTPIDNASESFLCDMSNLSQAYALGTCSANIVGYTW